MIYTITRRGLSLPEDNVSLSSELRTKKGRPERDDRSTGDSHFVTILLFQCVPPIHCSCAPAPSVLPVIHPGAHPITRFSFTVWASSASTAWRSCWSRLSRSWLRWAKLVASASFSQLLLKLDRVYRRRILGNQNGGHKHPNHHRMRSPRLGTGTSGDAGTVATPQPSTSRTRTLR